ncbi:TPA: hypothetical protein QDA95_004628 [Burkholderia vietnamiensis]|nr:hypothetical protein [Burkholderia vietnamiensis]
MGINNFKPFAAAGAANVMTQADFEAMAALLTGFQSGTAQSRQLNKVWRQSSIMSAVLAQFIVDLTGRDAIDDGTTATLLANLKAAVQAQSAAVVGQARNVAMSVTTASTSATLNADEIVVGTALGGQKYLLKQFSKTINLATTGAGGMDTGTAPVSGFVALYAIYNPTTDASALLATNATSSTAPNVYAGANMPTGYTASALVSVWPTDASSQFSVASQVDRSVSFSPLTALSTSAVQASPTSFSVAAYIPRNARTARGSVSLQSSAANANLQSVLSGSSANAGAFNFATVAVLANSGITAPYPDIPILTTQQMFYTANSGAGTLSFTVLISGYSI